MLKDTEVRISGGRDEGKLFRIKEMPAYDLEWFAIRAFQALGTSGITVPQDVVDAGAIGFALIAYQAFMGSTSDQIKPLRDEMMECVFMVSTKEVEIKFNPQMVFDISTLKTLREAWLKLHTGFTLAELALFLNERVREKMLKSNLPNTEGSQDQSEQSSASG